MATLQTYSGMMNDYLNNKLLWTEFIKRDWILSNIEMDEGWKQLQNYVVPFEGGCASSVEFGQLAASGDIAQSSYVRGVVSTHKEVWGSLLIYEKDLITTEGAKIPEATFLKLVPNEMNKLLDYMKQAVSTQLMTGAHFAKFMTNGTAGGEFEVDHIERFVIGQKLTLDDNNSAAADYYVIAININLRTVAGSQGTVTVSASRGGAAADVSAYTTAQVAKCYHPGVLTNGSFASLRESLLSLANGGSASLYGQTKLSYPYLQCLNIDGASWTSSNILDKIFDAYVQCRQTGRGKATKVLVSYHLMKYIMIKLESQKGPYMVTKSKNEPLYGWTSVTINSIKAELEIVAVMEAENDVVIFLDPSSCVFATNGGIKKRVGPDGLSVYTVRGTNGYQYITDIACYGEFVVKAPANNCIVYGVSIA